MDACYEKMGQYLQVAENMASELDAWFTAPGDVDDFIYFGDQTKQHSEK